MTPELTPISPELEKAVAEIREETPSEAVVEAAAVRVWARLSAASAEVRGASAVIRDCADFQALIPDFRAGRLPEARTALVRDHLHQCVVCRRVYEGKVATMPAPAEARSTHHAARWAVAATVLIVAGSAIWWTVNRNGESAGRAVVQSLDGTLYAVTADGLRPLRAGQDLPSDVELRTAKDSDAMLQLADGSMVEMRERSSLSTAASGIDLTVHLGRGSVMVKAKHRATGHLYVDTGDCRVAVTGTVFEVTTGVKGSRVSVVEGEVHVTQDNQEKVLHAGDQTATSVNVVPEPVSKEISWIRNPELLNKFKDTLTQVRPPALRYSSKLLDHLPAGTVFFVSIPNLSQYLADAQSVLSKKLSGDPQLSAMWNSRMAAVVDIMRTTGEYLGEEVDIVDTTGMKTPVMVSEQKREGFEDFLHKKNVPLTVLNRNGLVIFGPNRNDVENIAGQLDTGFAQKPLYAHIQESYRQGAGLMLWADLANSTTPFQGARYFSAESKQIDGQIIGSAALGFDGPRTGLAAQLAAPSALGSLDYVSPEALAVMGFVIKDSGSIVDAVLAFTEGSMAAAQQKLNEEKEQKGFNVRDELAASLGGEFAIAVDGSLMPVPSWKLVSEVYDPARVQATIQRFVDAHNQDVAKTGKKPIHMGQETVDGRVYYSVAQVDGGPLMEAHYTFDKGYLVAAPTRALVMHALQIKLAGTSIKHSGKFLELTPRDQHVNMSAVIYQNLGDSLAPIAALAGAMIPQGNGPNGVPLPSLTNIKPTLFAIYGEPDRITMRATGDVLGSTLQNLMSGDIRGMAGLPIGQMLGTHQRQNSYAGR